MDAFQGAAGDRDSHLLPKCSLQPLPGLPVCHTQQGGKEQWWGDTHPNTQTTNTKPAHTKNSQKNLPDNHGWDVGLDWDNFRHAETVLGC